MIWKKNTFQEIPLGLPVESPGAFRSWGIFQDPLGGWQRRGTHPTTLMMLGKTAARKRPIGRSDPTVEAIDPNAPISSLLPHMSITNMIIYSQLVIRATGLLQASTTLRGIDSGLFEGSWEGGESDSGTGNVSDETTWLKHNEANKKPVIRQRWIRSKNQTNQRYD